MKLMTWWSLAIFIIALTSGGVCAQNEEPGPGDEQTRQYMASVRERVLQHLDAAGMAGSPIRVVLTVRKDGVVTGREIQMRSDNEVFNRAVLKAIGAAAPLPPLPASLDYEMYRIGLSFVPGGS